MMTCLDVAVFHPTRDATVVVRNYGNGMELESSYHPNKSDGSCSPALQQHEMCEEYNAQCIESEKQYADYRSDNG